MQLAAVQTVAPYHIQGESDPAFLVEDEAPGVCTAVAQAWERSEQIGIGKR